MCQKSFMTMKSCEMKIQLGDVSTTLFAPSSPIPQPADRKKAGVLKFKNQLFVSSEHDMEKFMRI